jgi:predicted DNA-binding transcriptional regulator YafY
MPVNRNALLRYQVIDKCLRNRGRKWTWHDILEEVNQALNEDNPKSRGIGKTTLYEDLKDIEYRIYKLEIEKTKNGKTTYLRYANSSDSINNQPLNQSEATQLKAAVMVLSRFKGVPQFGWINEIVPIIESKMGLVKSEKEIISFESNIDYSGAKHIPALFNAILNKRVIKLIYQDFKSPIEYEVEIHPQYLKQFNSRWFIMSLTDKWKNKPQTHALDRIKDIQESETEYKELKDFDWDDYFSDMIGVTHFDMPLIEVKLLILDSQQAAYIDTKPLHQSQKKIKKVDQGYETSISVIPNYELEKLVLSFGERVKVLSPPDLVERLKERITLLYKNY